MNTETNNQANVDMTDEHKARLLVRDLLLNQEVEYWNNVIPELTKIASQEPKNTELLFPLVMLVKKFDHKDKQLPDMVLKALKEYGLINIHVLEEDEDLHVKYKFAMLAVNVGGSRSDVSSEVELLENFSLSELIVEFPDTYGVAKSHVAKRKQRV